MSYWYDISRRRVKFELIGCACRYFIFSLRDELNYISLGFSRSWPPRTRWTSVSWLHSPEQEIRECGMFWLQILGVVIRAIKSSTGKPTSASATQLREPSNHDKRGDEQPFQDWIENGNTNTIGRLNDDNVRDKNRNRRLGRAWPLSKRSQDLIIRFRLDQPYPLLLVQREWFEDRRKNVKNFHCVLHESLDSPYQSLLELFPPGGRRRDESPWEDSFERTTQGN